MNQTHWGAAAIPHQLHNWQHGQIYFQVLFVFLVQINIQNFGSEHLRDN